MRSQVRARATALWHITIASRAGDQVGALLSAMHTNASLYVSSSVINTAMSDRWMFASLSTQVYGSLSKQPTGGIKVADLASGKTVRGFYLPVHLQVHVLAAFCTTDLMFVMCSQNRCSERKPSSTRSRFVRSFTPTGSPRELTDDEQVVARISDDLSTEFDEQFPLERAHEAVARYRAQMGHKFLINPTAK